jgi:hypothetical protein
MDKFAQFIKSWDLGTIRRWWLLPFVLIVALLLPPLLLSFILTFILIIALKFLHPYSYALQGYSLPGCCISRQSRSPPIS